jgi:hypothetical protein
VTPDSVFFIQATIAEWVLYAVPCSFENTNLNNFPGGFMHKVFGKIAVAGLLVAALVAPSTAQAPQGAPAGAGAPGGQRGAQAPLASPNPIYSSIHLEVDVNKPAAEVWARVGKYCDIGEWLQVQCTITSGKDGELGAVRSIGNEVLVGKTDLSYTYTQPVRVGAFYPLYHGTVEAKPVAATTSKIIYSLVWDNSNLADDAARQNDKTNRSNTFTRAIQNMKTLAEGGTLPPPPQRGRGGAPGAGGPPRQ